MRRAVLLTLSYMVVAACGAEAPDENHDAGQTATLRVPELGPVPPLPAFDDDPITPDKIRLGTSLFFDTRLSGSGRTSCASCHVPSTSFQDNLILPTPDRSYPADAPTASRNTTSFLNLIYAPVLRWDGSLTDTVEGMVFPFAEPNMNIARLPAGSEEKDVPAAQDALHATLTKDIPGYASLYAAAFGVKLADLTPVETWRLTGRAMRALLTQVISRDAPFDRWNAGDDSAMNASAVRGLEVFRGKGRCISCHAGPLFTDFAFHNISTSPPRADGTRADEGRYGVTGKEEDRGAFLTPTLRGVYDTASYFHDGSRPGLRAVLSFKSSAEVVADPNHDPIFDSPPALTEDDVRDLVAFLKALRGKPIEPIVPPAEFP